MTNTLPPSCITFNGIDLYLVYVLGNGYSLYMAKSKYHDVDQRYIVYNGKPLFSIYARAMGDKNSFISQLEVDLIEENKQ